MAIDPSIALSYNQPYGPDVGKAMSLAAMMQEYQQNQQQIQRRNMLRQVLSQPNAIDPSTGTLNPTTLAKVTALDPDTGLKLQEHALAMQASRSRIQQSQLERHNAILEMVSPIRDSALNAYDETLKQTGSVDAANAAGQKALNEGIEPLKTGGQLSEEEKAQLRSKFDYAEMSAMSPGYRKEKRDVAKTKLDERRLDIAETRADAALKNIESEVKARDQKTTATAEGEIDDDTASKMARQYLTGDTSVMSNIGRGAQSAKNIAKVRRAIYSEADKQGLSPEEIAAKVAEFQGIKAGERTLGNRTAQVGMAVNEAKMLAPLALDASDKVNRSRFPKLNDVLLAAEKGTGDENTVRLGVATNSLINVYARAISPTGVPTVSDKDHARELLAAAWSKGQYKAGVDQLIKEMNAAAKSPGQTRQEFRDAVTKKQEPVSDAVPQVKGATPPTITTSEAYDKLPDGADYIGPDGKPYTKGGKKK